MSLKILVVTHYLNLYYEKRGASPYIWQLLKALYDLGNDVITYPFIGENIDTLWWRSYKPSSFIRTTNSLFKVLKLGWELRTYLYRKNRILKKKLSDDIEKIIEKERIDILIFFSIPTDIVNYTVSRIKKEYSIKVLFYELDIPIKFKEYQLRTYLVNRCFEPYDAVIIPSLGAKKYVKERLGAKRVYTIFFGVDPKVYIPIEHVDYEYDIFFYGGGIKFRETEFKELIITPLRSKRYKILIGGPGFPKEIMRLRNITYVDNIPFSIFREYVCKSKINVNIVRKPFNEYYA